MGTMASQITSLTIVYSTIYSGTDQRKHQSSPSLIFVREIHRGPVNSPHKWPVTRKIFPFDDVIMIAWAAVGALWLAYSQVSVTHLMIRTHFLSLARSKLRLCSANHRTGYFSNLVCEWLSIISVYSEQETENGPWSGPSTGFRSPNDLQWLYWKDRAPVVCSDHITGQVLVGMLVSVHMCVNYWAYWDFWAGLSLYRNPWLVADELVTLKLECRWTYMMQSSNGKVFRVTGPLCGEFTGHRWIPCTKASGAELWCFLWSVPQ